MIRNADGGERRSCSEAGRRNLRSEGTGGGFKRARERGVAHPTSKNFLENARLSAWEPSRASITTIGTSAETSEYKHGGVWPNSTQGEREMKATLGLSRPNSERQRASAWGCPPSLVSATRIQRPTCITQVTQGLGPHIAERRRRARESRKRGSNGRA
ncbi:MAG: hypothetical protein ACKER6_01230 [Candidatus Hodgkinia cicadicola]